MAMVSRLSTVRSPVPPLPTVSPWCRFDHRAGRGAADDSAAHRSGARSDRQEPGAIQVPDRAIVGDVQRASRSAADLQVRPPAAAKSSAEALPDPPRSRPLPTIPPCCVVSDIQTVAVDQHGAAVEDADHLPSLRASLPTVINGQRQSCDPAPLTVNGSGGSRDRGPTSRPPYWWRSNRHCRYVRYRRGLDTAPVQHRQRTVARLPDDDIAGIDVVDTSVVENAVVDNITDRQR